MWQLNLPDLEIDWKKLTDVLTYDPQQPMIFSSGLFLWLFLGFSLIYLLLQRKTTARLLFVSLFSYYFYYKSSGFYFFLLGIVTVSDFLLARWMYRTETSWKRKLIVCCSLCINLGLLCYFKYTNFFYEMLAPLWHGTYHPLDIFLPVGISFFTFQSLSYTIDVYRKDLKPLSNLLDYVFYVSFFPQLVAGPIVRARDFIPQIRQPLYVSPEMFGQGVFFIVSGLFKKAVISDYISVNFVERIFDNPGLYSGLENLFGVYGYALQIYCDFSGYSDMAIGLGRMFGFHFRENFNYPYTATTIKEFWRRWHISLSGWFRDYLYIPLGGNRKGCARTWLNRFLVFFATGLWHGASWTFVLWGLWHGLFSVLEDCGAIPVDKLKGKRIGQLYTLLVVVLGFTLFRADTLTQAGAMYAAMFSGIGLHWLGTAAVWAKFTPAFALTLCLALLLCTPVAREHTPKRESVTFIGSLGLLLLCMMYLAAGSFNPFIYFRF